MLKRLLDIATSVIALLLFSPAFLILGLLIKLETPGPVFFMQTRIGLNGKPFRMYKFRKFPHDSKGGPGVTLVRDPRMSKMGKILERFKLDELPQFINVFLGEMSIVGPRPETLVFAKHFNEADKEVLSVKPGIFGINQLIYRREASLYPPDVDPEMFYIKELLPLKISNDIEYIRSASLLSDMSILFKCTIVVLIEPFISKFHGILLARKQHRESVNGMPL